jgi:hypothetical protein
MLRLYKLAVHERWYTTKHENLTPTTPLHPYTPTPFFKLGSSFVICPLSLVSV